MKKCAVTKAWSIAALAVAALLGLTSASLACGTERWAIKVGSDPQNLQVLSPPVESNIAALSSLPAPSRLLPFSRVQPVETTVYQLSNVWLQRVDVQSDEDYRLTVSDDAGHTMFLYSPDPRCATGSRFFSVIQRVHENVGSLALDLGDEGGPKQRITVTGIGFFDFISAQPGQARNGIGLHPLLSICTGMNCGTGSTGGVPPAHKVAPAAPHTLPLSRPSPGPRQTPSPAPSQPANESNVDPDSAPDRFVRMRPMVSATCSPHYRWPIKVLTDSNAPSVNLTPQNTTISALRALPPPTPHPLPSEYPNRLQPVEYTTYRLTNVTLYSISAPGSDLDYDVILKDAGGNELLTESPNPKCAAGSVVLSQITAVRNYIDANFTPGTTNINVPVTVTGVGFYDPYTGPPHPPNASGFELHPLLSIVISGSASPSPSPSASASPSASPSPSGSASSTQGTVLSWDSSFYYMLNSTCGHFKVAYNGGTVFVPNQGAIVAGSDVTIIGSGDCHHNNIVATQITLNAASPSPSPSTSSSPFGTLTVSPSTLAFSDLTTTSPVTVSEQNYGGVFNQDSTTSCNGIVAVSPSSGNGPSTTLTVTPEGQGSCTITVIDDHGGSVPVSVSVNLASPSPSPSPSPSSSPSNTQGSVLSWDANFYYMWNPQICGHFHVAYNGSTNFVPSQSAIIVGSSVTIVGSGDCHHNNILATQISLN